MTLSDFHSVGVSGPLQSFRRPRNVKCVLKALTKSFLVIGVLLVGGGFPHILAFDAVGDDMDYIT